MINKSLERLGKVYNEFPRKFWFVVGVSFIDRIGGTLLFPFFTLYITQKFHVGMTEAGTVLGTFSLFGMFGSVIGGALTDRLGRRRLILFGLVFSAVSTLALGSVNTLTMLYPLAVLIGLLSDVAGPAHSAMIADILPEEKRQEGFGILRVVANVSWMIGPIIGGFLANRSYLALFVTDAVISCIVAVLFYLYMPETKPQVQTLAHEETEHETMLQTFVGYIKVLRDGPYVGFLGASVLMGLVYQQMYNSLSYYLLKNHGVEPSGYGFLMTSSAITVVLFQFGVTRLIKKRPPFLTMAVGVLFYVLGFSMFGVVSAYWLFVTAIVVITIGEMIIMPTSSALTAGFAPADMRGRYMAMYGLSWGLPAIVGPTAAGLILDGPNPNLLWFLGGALTLVSAASFYFLHLTLGKQERFIPQEEPTQPLPAATD
ncbi:MAG: MFS transporter [Chloroflexi bacterium]|nr:MFS transporter [Chloroflexota bacterium]